MQIGNQSDGHKRRFATFIVNRNVPEQLNEVFQGHLIGYTKAKEVVLAFAKSGEYPDSLNYSAREELLGVVWTLSSPLGELEHLCRMIAICVYLSDSPSGRDDFAQCSRYSVLSPLIESAVEIGMDAIESADAFIRWMLSVWPADYVDDGRGGWLRSPLLAASCLLQAALVSLSGEMALVRFEIERLAKVAEGSEVRSLLDLDEYMSSQQQWRRIARRIISDERQGATSVLRRLLECIE